MAGIHNALAGSGGPPPDFLFTISSNQNNANLRTLAVNAGWNESSLVIATISSGVVISSTSTGTPALTVSGSFPGGVTLTNSGTIVGMGGAGGQAGGSNTAQAGFSGGLALSVSSAITIDNTSGTIAGGGGGGGGGGGVSVPQQGKDPASSASGGGGGGGRSSNTNSAGGSLGSANRTSWDTRTPTAGAAGTYSAAGSGGVGGIRNSFTTAWNTGSGGNGGAWGSSGSSGGNANAGTIPNGAGGGAGGGAVTGNSNITWTAFGTRTGGIS